MKQQFYLFDTKGYLTTFAVSPDFFDFAVENGLYGEDSGRKIHTQLLFREYKGKNCYPPFVHFPVIFRHFNGKKLRDMLEMRLAIPCVLISDRMKSCLEENSISGLSSFPVRIFDKKGNEITGYHGFSITGKGGKIIELNHPEEDQSYYSNPKYNLWDVRSWDGSDFFRIKPSLVGVTPKVKNVLTENKIESPVFTPFEKMFTLKD